VNRFPHHWLTPDLASGALQCRSLFFPVGVDWLAIVSGALILLTDPDNFEPYGTATPDQTAIAFNDTFDKFSFNQGNCRVIGEVICYAGSASPDTRWLLCDGASLLRSVYPDLFSVIGVVYGSVDISHFSLPDLRSRVALGAGQGSGLSNYALGAAQGEETHTLITSEIPSHSHVDSGHVHSEGSAIAAIGAAIVGVPIPSAVPIPSITGVGNANLSSVGGDGAHNTLQPILALNFFIVALD
jgi:microcystin-dependent protein